MLRFLTAGESHGQMLVVIIEGLPADLPLLAADVDRDLARRQLGYGRGGRMRIEQDRAQIVAGVRHGRTLGSPLALLVPNRDWENWRERMAVEPGDAVDPVTRVRPGHADLAGALKYGQRDVRNILERASARETAARVAAGAVARRLLAEVGVLVRSCTVAIGGREVGRLPQSAEEWQQVEQSPLRCAEAEAERLLMAEIDKARAAGDTLGGVFAVEATGVPIGLGSHVHWDRRLDGRLAQALMSIPSVKGVEIGAGFAAAALPGSRVHDVFAGQGQRPWARATNRAGGLEGGITNGEPIVLRAACKPIPTLGNPLPSRDLLTGEPVLAHHERSDVCVVPAAGVVGEAMVCLVLADALLEKFGGDNLADLKRSLAEYQERCQPTFPPTSS